MNYVLGRGHEPTGIAGSGPFQVHLCGPSNGPVARNGATATTRPRSVRAGRCSP
jgi:hypothetical protein